MSALQNFSGGEIAVIVLSVIVMVFLSYLILKWIHENKDLIIFNNKMNNPLFEEKKNVIEEKKPPPTLLDLGFSRRKPALREKI
jgi:hypothetical protein